MRSIRSCNVAVIGGAGFLGSHLVNHLIDDRNCAVIVIDNLVAGRREFVHPKATFVHHDICGSEDYLRNVLVNFDPCMQGGVKYVFNYAAYPYIPDSFARPIHVCDVNFIGAMKVINAVQEAGCDGILQVSSAEIYGGPIGALPDGRAPLGDLRKIDEQESVVPHSSYGVAKAAVDSWVQCRWKEAKTPCIALRQFNCVGERETHPYVVPEIISQLARQQLTITKDGKTWYEPANVGGFNRADGKGFQGFAPTVKLGNNSFRDFLYAGDQVRIAVELLERGQFGEVYNLGSETGIKMYDLAKLIGEVMGFADVQVMKDESRVRPWEIWHLQSDNSKIDSIMDSLLKLTDLETALKRTVEWYNANGRKWPWKQ